MPQNDLRKKLCAVDRLEVGPAKVESSRIIVPYRIRQRGETSATDLIYKWEEPVFDPLEPASLNLAEMIGAQVALNYGLFCREIHFHGAFDAIDRKFISEMAENTAREIYVKKFLEPNPFLTIDTAALPDGPIPSFLQATLSFGNEAMNSEFRQPWEGDPERHAILSSGGKDSLLTYALLNEIGAETHPVFGNESGRHWYTALNAYRYFSKNVPNTTRVWQSSDRVFSWMLRHLPFIRKDFAKLPSDDYPIRLWTVAVFLFGALPMLRSRGVGSLLIGNEFDTTMRTRYRKISHYAGLYDQSRYFDNYCTRYFAQKGWGVRQFSILRPMSELLIQKTLVERYPELQRHQMSCHATHIEADRVFPCGKCEKCRRIIGMLVANGADPTQAGFSPDHVRSGLREIGAVPLHHERNVYEHLLHLLAGQGYISEDAPMYRSRRSHPEVMGLRFDGEHAPIDTIPAALREHLYKILLKHADGAMRKSGKMWLKFDPLGTESLSAPYRFERHLAKSGKEDRGAYLLGEMTWPEAKARLKETDIALLPIGSIEQHGRHLPLDTDAYDAEYLCREVARASSDPRPLVLPGIAYGVSYHHEGFAGTIAISPSTLSQLVYEIGMNVAKQGIVKIILVNGHGGNAPALHFAAQMINRDAHIFTCVDTGETSDAEIEKIIATKGDVHAGEIETSTALARRPHLVHMEQARPSLPKFTSDYLSFSSKKRVEWYVMTKRLTKDGVLGDPTKANAAKGNEIWKIMIANLLEMVEDLKGMSLDDIYQRRY